MKNPIYKKEGLGRFHTRLAFLATFLRLVRVAGINPTKMPSA
jgi:hypothetical protein